jgi:glutamate 5-kinase
MRSKILAAQKVTAAGIPMVITKGEKPDILLALFRGQASGTFFAPQAHRLASRKCWIAFSLKPKGVIYVDEGASLAMVSKGRSLLPSGIVGVDGDFGVGAAVEIKNGRNLLLARGLVNYSAAAIRTIMGLQTGQIKGRLGEKPYDEVVHRDNMTIMPACGASG